MAAVNPPGQQPTQMQIVSPIPADWVSIRRDFWTRVFTAAVAHSVDLNPEAAAQIADNAIQLFDRRFKA